MTKQLVLVDHAKLVGIQLMGGNAMRAAQAHFRQSREQRDASSAMKASGKGTSGKLPVLLVLLDRKEVPVTKTVASVTEAILRGTQDKSSASDVQRDHGWTRLAHRQTATNVSQH